MRHFIRYFFAMLALICTLGIPAMAGIPSVHLLCKSHGGHINEGCILVNSQGVRLSRELFDTHQDTITDGMVRTFANIGTASGGYDWRYGFINIQGKVVVPPIYKEASKFSSGLAWVMTAHGAAYIDTQGRVALQLSPQWVDAHDFHHGLALVRGKGYMIGTHPMSSIGPMRVAPPWSVIDKTGRIVMGYDPRKDTSPATGGYIAPAIDILSDFIDGKAVFRRSLSSGDRFSNELGLIDTQGRVVQEPSKKHWHESSLRELDSFTSASQKPSASLSKRFYVVDDFHEGLAWAIDASKDKKSEMHYKTQGFVDQRGRWIFKVDEQTLPVRPFHQGHAIVLINEYKINQGQTEALIDSTGRVVANYRLLVGDIRR